MYVKLNHFAIHLKITQYCKSMILQLKKIFIGTLASRQRAYKHFCPLARQKKVIVPQNFVKLKA